MKLSWNKKKKIGIALGGGGVRGLAHITILEVLDELGVTPCCVAGTSMGAIVGVLYCSGLKTEVIKKDLLAEGKKRLNFPGLEEVKDLLKWFQFVTPGDYGKSLFRADKFVDYLLGRVKHLKFEELQIPLKIISADFWKREQVVMEKGDLFQAIQASMAVPGIFAPVQYEGKLLVDGGVVNPVPWDILPRDCDIRIAVEVTGRRTGTSAKTPFITDIVFNSFEAIEQNLNRIKREKDPPDIYIEPELTDIGIFDFHKTSRVFEQTEDSKVRFRNELKKLL